MKRYEAGKEAAPGTYVNLKTGQFVTVDRDQAVLPAGTAKYLRIPLGLVFILGPLAGLAYIIFLPLAGIGGLIMFSGYRLRSALAPLVTKQAKE